MKNQKHESPDRKTNHKTVSARSVEDRPDADLAQGRRKGIEKPEVDAKTAALESAPESERWDPLPVSTGHKVPATPSEDEDEDGRSEPEQLVEDGVDKAERDQTIQASKDATKKNR